MYKYNHNPNINIFTMYPNHNNSNIHHHSIPHPPIQMISFHTSPDRRKTMMRDAIGESSRKRRWEPDEGDAEEELSKANHFSKKERYGSGKPGSARGLDIELHLETPLPVEWQRCLDIQSGEVHFYNRRTNKRTCNEPGKDDETTSDHLTTTSTVGRGAFSLNLELNLQPYNDHQSPPEAKTPYSTKRFPDEEEKKDHIKEGEGEEEEMVATVCARCHMLVMLCVSRPACPNCKFVHPKPDHTPFTLLLKHPKCTTQLLS